MVLDLKYMKYLRLQGNRESYEIEGNKVGEQFSAQMEE